MAILRRIYLQMSRSVYVLFYLINVIYSRRIYYHNSTEHNCWLPFQKSGNSEVNWAHYQTFYSPGGDTCFYLSVNITPYHEAEQQCRQLGQGIHLFSDEQASENQFIVEHIIPSCVQIHQDTDCSIWMGLRWNTTCSWLDGTPYSWSNWPEDLDDQCQQPHSDRYCPFMDRKGIWDARTCARKTYHLCEWQVQLPGRMGHQQGALAKGGAGYIAILVIFIIIILLLLIFLVFLLVGKFVVCPRMIDMLYHVREGNSPDKEVAEKKDKKDRKKTLPDFFKVKGVSFGRSDQKTNKADSEKNDNEDQYASIEDETLKIRKDEEEPFIEKQQEEKAKPATDPTYATPIKKKYMPKQDPHDEITVLETSIDS